jgi:predicted porin
VNKTIAIPIFALFASAAAHAQTPNSVVLYGILDVGVRSTSGLDSSNNPTPNNAIAQYSGMGPQSRWGFRGSESLGGGMKAGFNLEQGFEMNFGGQIAGAPFFDRQANLQLEGQWGQVSLGRHNTLVLQSALLVDPIGFRAATINPNMLVTSLIQHRTGVNWGTSGQPVAAHRQNNSVLYDLPMGSFTARAMYSFGGLTSSRSASSSYGLGLNYVVPKFTMTGGFTEYKDPTDRLTMTATNVGVAYRPGGGARYVFNVGRNTADTTLTTRTTNEVVAAGLTYPIAPSFELTLGSYHISRKRTGLTNDGYDRQIGYLDYLLSRRTRVYLQADLTRWKGGYQGVANRKEANGVSAGVTHIF